MRKAFTAILITLAVLSAMTRLAAAQRPGKDPKPPEAADSLRFLPLLAVPDVHADLKLPAETSNKIKALLVEHEDAIRAAVRQGEGTGKEKAERAQAAAAAVDQKLGALVDANQRARLRQIYLQARGGETFIEPEIATELKLEPAQREPLSRITQEMALANGQYAREFLGQVNFTDKAEAKARAEFLPKFLAVLTLEQKKTWETLTGPRFAGEVPLSALVLSKRRPTPPKKP